MFRKCEVKFFSSMENMHGCNYFLVHFMMSFSYRIHDELSVVLVVLKDHYSVITSLTLLESMGPFVSIRYLINLIIYIIVLLIFSLVVTISTSMRYIEKITKKE